MAFQSLSESSEDDTSFHYLAGKYLASLSCSYPFLIFTCVTLSSAVTALLQIFVSLVIYKKKRTYNTA
jgi:hypothetical protein